MGTIPTRKGLLLPNLSLKLPVLLILISYFCRKLSFQNTPIGIKKKGILEIGSMPSDASWAILTSILMKFQENDPPAAFVCYAELGITQQSGWRAKPAIEAARRRRQRRATRRCSGHASSARARPNWSCSVVTTLSIRLNEITRDRRHLKTPLSRIT